MTSPKVARIRAERQQALRGLGTRIDVDFLLEIPNLGLADGYGQSARSIVNMLIDICKEERLVMRIVNKRNLCGPIERGEEFYAYQPLLLDPSSIGKVKVFMRYALPLSQRYNAKRAIAMTMFETDLVPPVWVSDLNNFNLVITPTEWGASVFRRHIRPTVVSIPLPVHINYHQSESLTALLSNSRFRFITVGNYFQPDRKRIVPLMEAFSKYFADDNCELYVKTSWTDRGSAVTIPIDKVAARLRKNVILNLDNVSTNELIKIYCSSHAALFMSQGEGYGLPQVELALLGRPIVAALNSSMISLKEVIPWCQTVDCVPIESNYTPQYIKNAGNWGLCDIKEFLDTARTLYESWCKDKETYNQRIRDAHSHSIFREFTSHDTIKTSFKREILKQMELAE
jgi:hypothetical protein